MKAVVRCDATRDIGFGHLSRCIALAEALRLEGTVCSFSGDYDAAAKEQIAAAGFDAGEIASPDFVIVDSYRIDGSDLAAIREGGNRVVLFDDFCALDAYPVDVILNFTVEGPTYDYPEGPTLVRGPQYLPARRKLVEARSGSIERSRSGAVRNLLVAIGGSDPKQIAARLVAILRDRHADLCLHALAADDPGLEAMLRDFAGGSRILARLPDLSEQFVWADAVVSGGGLIKYESAYMGVPCAAIAQNEGQDGESKAFAGAGLVFDLGLADDVSDEELAGKLDLFLSDAQLRETMASRMRGAFPPDPGAHAARAILEALR